MRFKTWRTPFVLATCCAVAGGVLVTYQNSQATEPGSVAAAANAPVEKASGYDIVILNGRVMDPETKFDGVRNVGIKAGRIVAITKDKITGQQTINAHRPRRGAGVHRYAHSQQ